MVYALVAIIVVLLAVWIWLNTILIRKHNKATDELPAVETSMPETIVEQEPEREPEPLHIAELEVPQAALQKPQGIFVNSDKPFVLHDVNVPEFADMAFQTAFHHLSADERVLGWVAFQQDRIGASDRAYDQDFLEALRGHRQATERLRRHVGLSQVTETAVVGAEGKVWFLTVMEDAWFALFIDKDVDGMRLAQELMAPVQVMTSVD